MKITKLNLIIAAGAILLLAVVLLAGPIAVYIKSADVKRFAPFTVEEQKLMKVDTKIDREFTKEETRAEWGVELPLIYEDEKASAVNIPSTDILREMQGAKAEVKAEAGIAEDSQIPNRAEGNLNENQEASAENGDDSLVLPEETKSEKLEAEAVDSSVFDESESSGAVEIPEQETEEQKPELDVNAEINRVYANELSIIEIK